MKHWNLDIIVYWVTGTGCQIEKDLETIPSPSNSSKDYRKLLPLLISISWQSLVTSWIVVQKIYSKMYLVSCTNTHRDVTDLVNHGMVKNTKTWISWEQNIIFLQNKKILDLCLRWNILRSHRFVAEVTFKSKVLEDGGVPLLVCHLYWWFSLGILHLHNDDWKSSSLFSRY